jgi:thiol-disulfide isomerase/thioredoxin
MFMKQITRIFLTALIASFLVVGCDLNQSSVPPTTGIPSVPAKPDPPPETKPVSTESADQPKESEAREAIPSAVFSDINGKKIRTEDLRGKLTLVVYWATWCPPCRQEIPTLVEVRKKYSSRSLEMLAVSQDEEIQTLRNFLTKDKLGQTINYTVVHGISYTKPFGLKPLLPTIMFVDKDGIIIGTHEGMASEKSLSEAIEKYIY